MGIPICRESGGIRENENGLLYLSGYHICYPQQCHRHGTAVPRARHYCAMPVALINILVEKHIS